MPWVWKMKPRHFDVGCAYPNKNLNWKGKCPPWRTILNTTVTCHWGSNLFTNDIQDKWAKGKNKYTHTKKKALQVGCVGLIQCSRVARPHPWRLFTDGFQLCQGQIPRMPPLWHGAHNHPEDYGPCVITPSNRAGKGGSCGPGRQSRGMVGGPGEQWVQVAAPGKSEGRGASQLIPQCPRDFCY